MAPRPIEDVDLPTLGDDLLALLFALWALVSDLYLALWSCVSQIFWALWTCVEALWTLVCDLCLGLWSCVETVWTFVSQTVSTVWTFFVETFWNEFVDAMISMTDYVVVHPGTATVMMVLAFVVIPRMLNALVTFYLRCLDVDRPGALRNSYAANYQSTSHGRTVPRRSTPTRSQSRKAKGEHRTVGGGRRC